MLIYKDSTEQFINAVKFNELTGILEAAFKGCFGHAPSKGEAAAWQNSLPRIRDLIELAQLKDNIIAIEYEVPYNQNRIDCLLFGRGVNDKENLVLIELKQWTEVKAHPDEGNFVETYVGKGERLVPHPSQQAKGYHDYLLGFIDEFDKQPPLQLFSCSYCHNYNGQNDDGLFAPQYMPLLKDYPIYTRNDVKKFADRIKELLQKGDGFEIFNRFMRSQIRPTKKLLENVSKIIKNEAVFSLLNEQLVAKNLIWSKIKLAKKQDINSTIIVHGGPGTGKSLIALNVLADAATKKLNVAYGCKSKPFTSGLQKLIGRDGRQLITSLLALSRLRSSKINSTFY